MTGIRIAAEETWNYINAEFPLPKPHNVIFYADNAGTIDRIFDGKPGKGQAHSRAFRKTISKILNNNEDTRVAISWCPSHSGITGNISKTPYAPEEKQTPEPPEPQEMLRFS